ncbi:type 4 prepilin-like proteins leader peptide-processing enzyme [Clostridia bacterium]|nr:type 4 prepilin-like proteins leader peptide-processing enzyme [Clostridia bacterium]
MQIALYIIAAVYGLVVGSFVGVCIDRLPAGEDIVRTPSHCPKCGRKLRAWELVPVFSWLLLRGKCHGCGCSVPARYPLIELANAALWAACAFRFAEFNLLWALVSCLAMSVLLAVAVTDAETGLIPVGYNAVLLVLGVCAIFVTREPLIHVIGLFALSVPLYLVYVLSNGRAIGGGDVKFLAAAGLLLGWKLIILSFVCACVLASIIHGFKLITKRANRTVRLGPYLAAGAAFSILFGEAAISVYVGFLIH